MAAWLVVGLGIILLIPGLARRIGASLAKRQRLVFEGENRLRSRFSLHAEAGPCGVRARLLVTPENSVA